MRLAARIDGVYQRLRSLIPGVVRILIDTARSFDKARAPEGAASLAYYALFSLFPLLLVLTSAAGFFLESGDVYGQAMELVKDAFPIAPELIERNITEVLEARRAVGAIGLIGLLWTALGAFAVLARNINLAWPQAEPRGFLRGRLVALTMVGALGGLLVLSLVSTTVGRLLPRLTLPIGDGIPLQVTGLWAVLSNLAARLAVVFVMFFALYRWVPNTESAWWPEAVWGALAGALAWEGAAGALGWAINTGLARYELVYGSLGTVVAFMLWIYICSYITLFGAHLSAAIGRYTEAQAAGRRGRGEIASRME